MSGQWTGESYTSGPLAGVTVSNSYDGLLRRTNVAVLVSGTSHFQNSYPHPRR